MTYSFDSLTIDLPDEEATLAAGHALAQCLQPGMTVYLQGDLGAGKPPSAVVCYGDWVIKAE